MGSMNLAAGLASALSIALCGCDWPSPEPVGTPPSQPYELTVDGTHAYVLGERELVRIPREGGDVELIADRLVPGPDSAGSVRMFSTATHIVWREPAGLARVPLEGGAVEVAALQGELLGSDGTDAFFTDRPEGGPQRLWSWPATGAPVLVLERDAVYIDVSIIDAAALCWSSRDDATLRCLDRPGWTERVVAGGVFMFGGAMDHARIYWVAGDDSGYSTKLWSADRDGDSVQRVGVGPFLGSYNNVALDDHGVYTGHLRWPFGDAEVYLPDTVTETTVADGYLYWLQEGQVLRYPADGEPLR